MSIVEGLGAIPPKEARDKFNGEEICAAMIESENIENLDKVKGAKRKLEISISREDAILASAKDNMVYELEDGTITHELPKQEIETR